MGLIDKLKSKVLKSKKSKIITLVIAVLLVFIVVYSVIKAQDAKTKAVTLTAVTKGSLTQSVTISGSIEANGRNDISLNPSSKVVQVMVKEGQAVEKGDVLVKLDDSEYKNQLEKQQINLSNASSTMNYITGSSSQSDRDTAEGAYSQAQITLDNSNANYNDASKKYEQSKVLFDHGYISANELDAARKAVADCSNAVTSAEIALNNAKNTYSNINATVGEKINNQRTQLSLINADIKYLTQKIDDCSIKANVAGVVTKIDAVEGQYPAAGDKVIVDQTSSYIVSLNVSQYDSIKLKTAQKAVIKVKGMDKEYEGIVDNIAPLAEKSITGTDQDAKVNVKVALTNPDESIRVGYEADADIILDERQDAVQVSFEAVQEEKSTGKKYVFVVGNSKKAEKRYIETGLETDYNVEIKTGLKEGEKCVANPDKTLANGDMVKETGGTN